MRIACLLVALPLFGQVSTTSTTVTSSNMVRGTLTTSGRSFMGTPVVGAPYSAQRITEHVQVGADGTRFTQNNMQEKLYRDSQGRTRSERTLGPDNLANAPVIIEIQDPLAGYGYTLDPQNKIAHRYQLKTPEMLQPVPARAASTTSGGMGYGVGAGVAGALRSGEFNATVSGPANAAAGTPARPAMQREDLGEQVIEGIAAKGTRITQTFPTGSQGNDRPFSIVNETWMSTELREMVLSKNVDPRSGENTTKLTNISRAEPSADLFLPPADYQVVDDAGPFQIHWEAQRK